MTALSAAAHDRPRAGVPSIAGRAQLGNAAVIVWNDVADGGRAQFYDWHDKEHVPERLALPGFRRGRRFACAGGSPEWLTVYEADSVDVLKSPEYLARLNAPTPLTRDTLRHFRNTSRAVCRLVASLGSSNGGHVLALRLDVPEALEGAWAREVAERWLPQALGCNGIVAGHLYAADRDASLLDTAESRTRRFEVPAWVLLAEATHAQALATLPDPVAGVPGASVRTRAVYVMEICRLPGPAAS